MKSRAASRGSNRVRVELNRVQVKSDTSVSQAKCESELGRGL